MQTSRRPLLKQPGRKLIASLSRHINEKIERLKGELHLLDAEGKQKNKHTFFVDSKKEVQTFDLASHLNTAPELVNRVYNRPTLHTLETKSIKGAVEPENIM
ncbi:Small subunit (SSU) processome component, partial [Ilyodon furcidens]